MQWQDSGASCPGARACVAGIVGTQMRLECGMSTRALVTLPVVSFVSVVAVAMSACGASGGPKAFDAGEPVCPPQTGAGTEHQGVIAADETWTAASGPHVVTFDVSINKGTVTVEPCVVVRVKKGYTISVGGGNDDSPAAGLIARGTATHPILFTRAASDEPWGMIAVNASATVDLENVTLSGGGDHATAQDLGGTLKMRGPIGYVPQHNVRVKNVRIERSAGHGVNVQTAGGFSADSSGLVIVDSGRVPGPDNGHDTSYPIFVTPPSIQTLPPGTFTGNAKDGILVGAGPPYVDETFHERGVPYRLERDLVISPMKTAAQGGLHTLTIEAGVKIQLLSNPTHSASIKLGSSGGDKPEEIYAVKLVAVGTAERPIVFTSASATPVAGDWGGLAWGGGAAAGNVMSHVRIEYAGGDLGTRNFGCGPAENDAAIIITNWRPDSAFMDHVTIASSRGGGIVSGWYTDADGPNLKTGNTFVNIGNGCAVSRWQNTKDPVCPAMPPVCL